jgi:hypothetical protein
MASVRSVGGWVSGERARYQDIALTPRPWHGLLIDVSAAANGRMLCLKMAVLACGLLLLASFVSGAAELTPEQQRAIAQVKKMGGKVEIDKGSPIGSVVGVDLSETKVIDASLEHLKALTGLQVVILKGTRVTDDGVARLKGLTDIEALELSRTRVTDKGLEYLKGFPNLRRLDLGGTQITDDGLEHLRGLTRLETLSLAGTRVTDAGLVHVKRLAKIRTLDLSGTRVTDACLEHLRGLNTLRKIDLTDSKVTPEGTAAIQRALPKVRVVR